MKNVALPARWLAIALALCACQRVELTPDRSAPDPTPTPEATPVDPAPDGSAQDQDGEIRAQTAGASLIGQPAPAFTLTTIDGATIDLTARSGGRPIYLKFWATWCVPCREQMPGFEQIFQTMQDRLEVLAVNTGFSDNEPDVRAFRQQYDLHMPIVIDDGSLAAAFHLRVTPQHVIIGRDGRIAHIGHLDDARLRDALKAAVSAPDAPVAPLGPVPAVLAFKPGALVHDLALTTTTGAVVSLGPAVDRRPTALLFLATWCESYLADTRPKVSQACLRAREQAQTLAAAGDAHWLAIASGLWTSDKDLTDFAATTGTKLPLALDRDDRVVRAFGARQIPAVALLDGDGRLVRMLGPDDDLAAALAALHARPGP